MFSSGQRFKDLCTHIKQQTKANSPTLLLINGDFVDFLAQPRARVWNPDTAVELLREIHNETAFKPVFDGLKQVVARNGAHVVFVLGNHDLELALPDVQAALTDILTGNTASRRSRVEFVCDGNGYRFSVGNASALATHGNETDKYNFTRFDQLQTIVHETQLHGYSALGNKWIPSAGAKFVIDAINHLKTDFPFVDLLKPEEVTLAALPILAPSTLGMAHKLVEMASAANENEEQRPQSERRFLQLETTAASPQAVSGSIEQLAQEYMLNPDLDIDLLIYGADTGTLGWLDDAKQAVSNLAEQGIRLVNDAGKAIARELSDAAQGVHANVLRNALWPLVSGDIPEVASMGEKDQALLQMVHRNYDVVFTGHTHARRFCEIGTHVGWYVNTGTWAGLMRLAESDIWDAQRFREFYRVLISGQRTDLEQSDWFVNERTVAVLEKEAATTELSLKRIDDSGALVPKDRFGRTFAASIA